MMAIATRPLFFCKVQDVDAENHANIKFLVELGYGEFDEIIAFSHYAYANT
jgi:hypothetical protein